MNAESLFASAAINIGFAMFILSLFSILKKQPSNASIYYARPLSLNQHIPFEHTLSLRRFLPSVFWISRAIHLSEDQILSTSGLDALVLIKLFKFGIAFFVVCSLVGVVILLPINYTGHNGPSKSSHSMDSFTISNINSGSNRLWVHFLALWFISFFGFYQLHKNQAKSTERKLEDLRHRSLRQKRGRESSLADALREDAKIVRLEERLEELSHRIRHTQCKKLLEEKELPVAFVTFRSRWGAALAAQSQQHSDPLLWITELAPEPRDVLWRNLAIPYRRLPLYKIGVFVAASLVTIFFAVPVTAVQGIAKFERLRRWFPPAMAIQLIPGLRSIITGYLPSVVLSIFVYIVPFAMIGMAKLAGYISRSEKDIKACNMVFYFLVGNVFFLTLLSGSLLDQIGESIAHPRGFPSRLASSLSAQADFFMTYILTNGLAGYSLEVLQLGLLIWDRIKSCIFGFGRKKDPYLYSVPYYRVIPFASLSILIGMVYAVVAPLLLPFLIVYFLLGYVVFVNQIQDVYETRYETCGQYWPHIHRNIFIAILLTQISMIGLFGLKSKPSASFATVPLIICTLLFNEYCKMRFLPTFRNYAIQDAMENDELDERNGLIETNYQNAVDAYCPPCLRPVNFTAAAESCSTMPL